MPTDRISIQGASQHNLKNISVDIPHRKITAITGRSGSGKSSLAFDTLYAEGQRRYIESLSTYAKQFLERMTKPDVRRIDGIFPAVSIEQKNPTTSTRSTVGTATEINDYLRLLFARAGVQSCHVCQGNIVQENPSVGAAQLLDKLPGARVTIAFALTRSGETDHDLIAQNLLAMGFVRVIADGTPQRIDELPENCRLDRVRELLVAIDRVTVTSTNRSRLAESLLTAFLEGEGHAFVLHDDGRLEMSDRARCTDCGAGVPTLGPTLFSFNNPRGACSTCNGFGAVLEYDEQLIVPDPDKSLADGAIDPWTKPRYTTRRRILREVAERKQIPYGKPWAKLSGSARSFLLDGKKGHFAGAFPFLRDLEKKRYKQYIRVFLRQYQRAKTCADCRGGRLRPEALAVTIDSHRISDVSSWTASNILPWITHVSFPAPLDEIATPIRREIESRIRFLVDVGLGYLTLDRQTRTLSGGEAQRISLANALGSQLIDTMYVLDEPSIGLHPRDVDRLLNLVERLRDAGNTLVVVEHDLAAISRADHMIELGPGSGTLGGEVTYAGSPDAASDSLTGKYLSGELSIPVPTLRRPAGPLWVTARGATLHNVENAEVSIPLGAFTVVTGVSGSGKSTLVHDILYRQLAKRIKGTHGAKEHLGEQIGEVSEITGWEKLSDIILVDQSPIGRSPRSNPVTYVRAFDEIRQLFARQPLAQARGFTATHFSFNAVGGGRCAHCEGAGHIQVEMVFLADVFVPCEACNGARFRPDVLDVRIKGLSIHDVLQLTVDDAIVRFRHQDKLGKALWHLQQVGLGYLRLGQPATTLSGGEAQRLKIARQLVVAGRKTRRRLFILDEPTTGLHLDDIRTLLKVFDRLVDGGDTVVVIEHHLDVIKRADWVIDVGPEGGDLGGKIVAAGPPEAIAEAGTITGTFLRTVLPEVSAELPIQALMG